MPTEYAIRGRVLSLGWAGSERHWGTPSHNTHSAQRSSAQSAHSAQSHTARATPIPHYAHSHRRQKEGSMSIRHSLLAILAEEDCYGYQLKQELERRTGNSLTINVGQIYTTLERLQRDQLVTPVAGSEKGQ